MEKPVDQLGRPLASIRRRFAALAIDYAGLVLLAVFYGSLVRVTPEQDPNGNTSFALTILGLLAFLVYTVVANGGRQGQTLGKMVMRIAVRRDGSDQRIGIGRSSLHALVGCLWPFSYLPALFSNQRQTLPDMAAHAVVIEQPPLTTKELPERGQFGTGLAAVRSRMTPGMILTLLFLVATALVVRLLPTTFWVGDPAGVLHGRFIGGEIIDGGYVATVEVINTYHQDVNDYCLVNPIDSRGESVPKDQKTTEDLYLQPGETATLAVDFGTNWVPADVQVDCNGDHKADVWPTP